MTEQLTIEKIVQKLPAKFNPEQAGGLNVVYQFSIHDADDFYLSISETACTSTYGNHKDPDITLIMDETTLIRVISGEQDGMSAFMKGQLRAEGNVMLATRLGKLFKR
ncbi:MAG: SCP-2 family sterol carrier protein [Oceanospirillales bacterium]|jgi:putative sterol carrier protein|nr:MAG: SCP-2 family sterol carrier protein [Oceanospirillales bacterium]